MAAALTSLPLTATASSITFAGSSGNLAASAQFSLSGTTLTVVLTNTSANDMLYETELLTGVFFSFTDPSLARVSAVLTAGSQVYQDPDGQPAGGVVGGEWAYKYLGVNAYRGGAPDQQRGPGARRPVRPLSWARPPSSR